MTKTERVKLQHMQNLFGEIGSIADNDRDPYRMDKLKPKIKEGFDLCIDLLAKYPAGDPFE